MTIERFMTCHGIRRRKTVVNWIKKGYIPNADIKNNYVPDSARPPYTDARAKNANAIYCSMVKAAFKRKHIFPELYHMCQEEFDGYIERLVAANLIIPRTTDGITYYDSPLSQSQCKRNFILAAIEHCSRGVSQGATTAVLAYANQ